MTRRLFTPTRTTVAVQTASLLFVAACVIGILITDIIRSRLGLATADALLSASPGRSQHVTNAGLVPEPR